MAAEAPRLEKGQMVEIHHDYLKRGPTQGGRVTYRGEITELYGGPLTAVALDGDDSLRVYVVHSTRFTVKVKVIGWAENTIAYADICEDGNPGHPDIVDALMRFRDGRWVELTGKGRPIAYPHDSTMLHRIRVVHDGQVPS